MDPSLQSMVDGLLNNQSLNELVDGPDDKFKKFLDNMFQPSKFFPLEDPQKKSSGILLAVLKVLAREKNQQSKISIIDETADKARPQIAVAAGGKRLKKTTKKSSKNIHKTHKRTKHHSRQALNS